MPQRLRAGTAFCSKSADQKYIWVKIPQFILRDGLLMDWLRVPFYFELAIRAGGMVFLRQCGFGDGGSGTEFLIEGRVPRLLQFGFVSVGKKKKPHSF